MTGTPTAVPFARWRQASRRGGSCYLDQSQRRGNGVWRASRRLGQRDTGPPGATAGASTPSGPCLHPGPICLSPCDNREVARWGASLALRAVTESFKHNFFPQHTYAVTPGAEAPAQPCEAPVSHSREAAETRSGDILPPASVWRIWAVLRKIVKAKLLPGIEGGRHSPQALRAEPETRTLCSLHQTIERPVMPSPHPPPPNPSQHLPKATAILKSSVCLHDTEMSPLQPLSGCP